MNWLVASLVLSIVLTVALNVVIRLFPNAPDRVARRLDELDRGQRGPDDDRPRVRVYFPWKWMLVASLLLTLALNLLR
jgi:hypothetical protein